MNDEAGFTIVGEFKRQPVVRLKTLDGRTYFRKMESNRTQVETFMHNDGEDYSLTEADERFLTGCLNDANLHDRDTWPPVDKPGVSFEEYQEAHEAQLFYGVVTVRCLMRPHCRRRKRIGDMIPLSEFRGFLNSDGHGYLCNDSHYWDREISPSEIREEEFNHSGVFTHVLWFNK